MSVNSGCTTFGNSFTSVVGGIGNQALNMASSIVGGYQNTVGNLSGTMAQSLLGGLNRTLSSITNEASQAGPSLFSP